MPPKVIQRSDRGVLPVPATARAPKPTARLKLEIRRLPPGLTLTELEETLGDEWKLNNGKVDWREYRQGRVKGPSRLPEQSRCYIHVKSEDLVKEFEQRFLSIVFHDKAGTHKIPELKQLPPTLGFALNQRTPLQTKPRADNRQGTIDQDPEFIAFLEAETQPIAKPAAIDSATAKEKENIKSTPLIDDLREKKANKAKAAANKAEKEKGKKAQAKVDAKDTEKHLKDGAKSSKQKDQGGKTSAKASNKQNGKQKEAVAQSEDTVKPAASATPKKASPSKKTTNSQPDQAAAATTEKVTGSPAAQRQRQPRNNLEGIKKQLHKDLGVKPAAAKSDSSTSKTTATNAASTTTQTPTAASGSGQTPASTKSTPTARSNTTPDVSKTKAYLKHANPSQGMTEVLIQQALSVYGEVSNVTIDPRKGTAVAVFKDNAGLKKAMAAKKVTVANGAVEVLEFKERGGGGGGGGGNTGASSGGSNRNGARNNRGGKGGGRGGSTASQNTSSTTTSAPST